MSINTELQNLKPAVLGNHAHPLVEENLPSLVDVQPVALARQPASMVHRLVIIIKPSGEIVLKGTLPNGVILSINNVPVHLL